MGKGSVSSVASFAEAAENGYSGFNTKYGKQYVLDYMNLCRKWNKFVSKDVLVSDAQAGMHYAASYGTISTFMTRQKREEKDIPGARFGFWPIHKDEQNMLPGVRITDYKAWNFLCIPTTSNKIDRTMQFIDWVYGNQMNNDLFQYGIEGQNWVAVGDDQWDLPKGVDATTNYIFPAYQLGQSPVYGRIQAGMPGDVLQLYKYQFKADTFIKSAVAGFSFDTNSVKSEVAKCAPIAEKYMQILGCGVNADPVATLREFNKELAASGMDAIKAELKRQLDDYLAMSRYRN